MYTIETRKLTKYYGKDRGIEDLDLSIPEGEIYGFIGPNGAGKSTTIRMLLSLMFPTRGEARVLGKDPFVHGPQIRKEIGFVPSEVNYYSNMSVRELLRYSASFYGLSLNGHYQKLVDTLEVDPLRKIDDLSMGNKKKVAIIQSLLHQPKLLILDEPTSGLDPLMQHRFFDLLKEANQDGTTIFFSSHILSEVEKFCHRVAIIKEGKVVDEAHVSELKKKMLSRVTGYPKENQSLKQPDLSGVISFEQTPRGFTFLYQGDIQELLTSLATQPLDKLTIEEPDLEEVFMHYYQDENREEGQS